MHKFAQLGIIWGCLKGCILNKKTTSSTHTTCQTEAASTQTHILVRGARTHNLKNIDLNIPRNQLVVITGLSGSGKSSLAFDTLYAEGQRRYVESLSVYARQFLQIMEKPDVDVIEGLSPAISIEQKATSHNPRSTVGTVTEIHDYLRLLFARAGTPHCPTHHLPLQAQTVSQMVDAILALPSETKLMLLAPLARNKKGSFADVLAHMQALGYVRFRIDGQIVAHDALPVLDKNDKHNIDVVVDRLKVRDDARQRLAESIESALQLADGRVIAFEMDSEKEHLFNATFACPKCQYSIAKLEPRLFSFNSPQGACPTCGGLGSLDVFDAKRIVGFPSLSLASGAIKGWDQRNQYYFSLLESVCKHYKVDIHEPFEKLPKTVRDVILHGSGDEKIPFNYRIKGKELSKTHTFEGVLPNMERRWHDTDSAAVREELSRYRQQNPCSDCNGTRLRPEARHVLVGEGQQQHAIYHISSMTLAQAQDYFAQLKLHGAKAEIASKVIREIATRLKFLNDVGLGYLSLNRSANSLSGGEAQRIRVASQIGSGLTGVMYVLDEPSIGLHQRDNDRLIATLKRLRDIGNSVLVVEHDEDIIRAADHVIDIGAGAGAHGGSIMAQGHYTDIQAAKQSPTGQYLSGAKKIEVPTTRTAWLPCIVPEAAPSKKTSQSKANVFDAAKTKVSAKKADATQALQCIDIHGAAGNNLKNVDVRIPVGLLTCVTGVSGSGKSTLINDTLYTAAAQHIHRAHAEPAAHNRITGFDYFDKVINVNQSPIGRTPRSNPATYTGLFTHIRELMADMPMARERGYSPGRFSFNVSQKSGGGRCEACQGDGVMKVEMHFLPDVYVPCDICSGQRYNRETLQVQYKGKNIAQILNMTIEEAGEFMQAQPAIMRKIQTLLDVGLGYIKLGQSATTLSGGEAQRVKLACELSRRDTGRTLYVLDEPTTGLHFADIDLLLKVLHKLRDAGNTIVIIEHNLDVIKTADWIIDMGPEGGEGGGTVVAQGTPEAITKIKASHTGQYLGAYLRPRSRQSNKST